MKKYLATLLCMVLLLCATFGALAETTETESDFIVFGSFEQSNSDEDGVEPIEWQVLAEEDGKKAADQPVCAGLPGVQ